ncbi:MAG: MFS transporter, partial [Betaproteobacteria bacterium]
MSPRPYRVLRHRDFRLLWLSQLASQTGSQMQTVALHWHVYLLTGSALALGALGLTRVVPIVVFSLWGGVTADRRDRRVVMFAAQATMLAGSLGLAALTFTAHESLGALYAANALLAAATAFDNPARNALVPRLVPTVELPAALS